MGEVKKAVIAALVLAFVAGIGAGAWIGDLRAAGEARTPSMDRRVQAWTDRYGLDASQQRRLRDVLLRYDARRQEIVSEIDAEQWRRIDALREVARKQIDAILAEREPGAPARGG